MILTVQKARGDSTDADLGQVIDMPHRLCNDRCP